MNVRIGQTQVTGDGQTLSWTGGAAIDGDGAPRAYSPPGSGLPALDFLANAGKVGNWYGLVCDPSGAPYVQGDEDPAPGYYISPTALADKSKDVRDPTRYVDSSTVPYISIPPELKAMGARLGDLCRVSHCMQTVLAVVADIGPRGKLGEISIACANALGIPSSPKNGGATTGISYSIMLGTAATPPWPRDLSAVGSFA